MIYSITSSARASSVGGTSRPSALAVLRLITRSYLVGACAGRSAGYAMFLDQSINLPRKLRSTSETIAVLVPATRQDWSAGRSSVEPWPVPVQESELSRSLPQGLGRRHLL